jgi:hypothetical protein
MATFEYDTKTSSNIIMKYMLVHFAILFLSSVAVHGRTVELVLYPAKVSEIPQKYQLLPRADKQIDEDAVPLYEKAVQSIPNDLTIKQIQEWLKVPAEQLPQQQAEAALQKCMESLRLVARAVRCKKCNWPPLKPGATPPDLSGYRNLQYIIRLWARLETARAGYEGALLAMQTGFGMARHVGRAPVSMQVQTASAIGEVMCREVDQFIQCKDSPNLYEALSNLPRPLVDMEKAIEKDLENLKDYNLLVRRQSEKILKPVHEKMRMIERRANTRLNALQSVEAIRHYSATHARQLPQVLDEIEDLEIPKDLMGDKAFGYRRTATGATLQSAIPEGGNERDAVRYEIVLKK